MRIAVLSDTHIPRRGKALPEILLRKIRGVDLILHAGDISRDYVLYELAEIATVEAVAGNTDDEFVLNLVPKSKVIQAEGCRIGLVHGDGSRGTTLDRAKEAFAGEKVDCIVFGHSHIPMNDRIDGVLYFNPGSPTDKRTQEHYSFGILTVEGDRIRGELHFFDR